MEENIIYLSTKMEFDGEKVPKTYKTNFETNITQKIEQFSHFFGNIQIMQKSIQKNKTPPCILHQSNNCIVSVCLSARLSTQSRVTFMHSLMVEMSERDVGDDVGGDGAHNIEGKERGKNGRLCFTSHYTTSHV